MKIIVNPKAGHGSAARGRRELELELREKGLPSQILETEYSGHATELARGLAASGEEIVVVFGGDGTISEVANGLVATQTQLGVIAAGTGNDFARSLGLPYNDTRAALEVIQAGRVIQIDVGREGGHHFISTFGLGFPAAIAQTANRMRRLRGPAAFFAAVYRGIYRMEAVPMEIRLDDKTILKDCTSILVQNTEFCGGGLRMAPGARVDDGQLDVIVVGNIGKLDLMINFPKAYRGTHLQHPKFFRHRANTIQIRCDKPLDKMFDGDIYGTTPAQISVIPKAISVIVPGRRAA